MSAVATRLPTVELGRVFLFSHKSLLSHLGPRTMVLDSMLLTQLLTSITGGPSSRLLPSLDPPLTSSIKLGSSRLLIRLAYVNWTTHCFPRAYRTQHWPTPQTQMCAKTNFFQRHSLPPSLPSSSSSATAACIIFEREGGGDFSAPSFPCFQGETPLPPPSSHPVRKTCVHARLRHRAGPIS